MPYIDDEISNTDGQPNELYKFEGAFQSYFYTTGPIAVSFLGDDYIPITMDRTDISSGSQEDDNLSIQIDLPIGVDLVQHYAFQIAPPTLRLTIYRYHDIAEWIPAWQGFVGQIKVNDGRASVRSPSVLEYALSGSVPNVFYQTICNHQLFDQLCQVSELLWSQAAVVDAIAGRTLTLSTIGTLDGVLVGGSATLASGETRMIVAQSGNQITVNFGYSSINVTDAITIRAGCNHDSDCQARFANGINYGGFKYIPPENVFDQGIEPGNLILADGTCGPSFTINLSADENSAISPTAALTQGITISGIDPDRVLNFTLPTGQLYTAWSRFGSPSPATPGVSGSEHNFHIVGDGDISTAIRIGDATLFNGYEAARSAFGNRSITGYSSYTFYFFDDLLGDNIGGLSILVTYS